MMHGPVCLAAEEVSILRMHLPLFAGRVVGERLLEFSGGLGLTCDVTMVHAIFLDILERLQRN